MFTYILDLWTFNDIDSYSSCSFVKLVVLCWTLLLKVSDIWNLNLGNCLHHPALRQEALPEQQLTHD